MRIMRMCVTQHICDWNPTAREWLLYRCGKTCSSCLMYGFKLVLFKPRLAWAMCSELPAVRTSALTTCCVHTVLQAHCQEPIGAAVSLVQEVWIMMGDPPRSPHAAPRVGTAGFSIEHSSRRCAESALHWCCCTGRAPSCFTSACLITVTIIISMLPSQMLLSDNTSDHSTTLRALIMTSTPLSCLLLWLATEQCPLCAASAAFAAADAPALLLCCCCHSWAIPGLGEQLG